MTLVRIDKVGAVGIVKDQKPWELPANAWSDGNNVRMQDNAVKKMTGYQSVTTPSASPYWILPLTNAGSPYILYFSLTSAYVYTGGVSTDISNGTYGATETGGWNGGVLNGVAIANNGVDVPQMWVTPPNVATDLANLSNWPAATTAKVIRPFKNFLVAMDVTESGTRKQRLVRTSHPAEAGAVPSSWDYTDTTKDARRFEVSETDGACVDFLPLNSDVGVIYKEDSCWAMSYIGPPLIWRLTHISKTMGILNRHCVQEFEGKHFVVSNGDIFVHAGGEPVSVLDGKMRRHVFNDMDATYYVRAFVVANRANNEMWFCYPASGEQWPSKALVWNWRTGAAGIRDLPDTTLFAAFGVLGVGSTYAPAAQNVIAGHGGPSLSVFDKTNQDGGANMTAYVERQGLSLPDTDTQAVKFVKRIYPRITGTGTINVYVAGTMNPNETPTYGTPVSFVLGTDEKVDCRATGRFINVKFESTGNQDWQLDGYDLDFEYAGMN
jgi:hypothetical protein